MPVETRYARSDQVTVNGLTAYSLGTANTSTESYLSQSYGASEYAWYADCIVRRQNGSEVVLGSSVAQVLRSASGEGAQQATWSCPQTTLNATDSVHVRFWIEEHVDWTTKSRDFTTEQLNAAQLDAATWTFTYYTYLGTNQEARLYHGSSTKATYISGFSYTSATTGTPVTITKQARYAIAATYSQAKNLAYRIATQSSLSKPLQYAIGVAQTVSKQARYAVAAGVSQTKELTYRVAAQAAAIQKSARYAVASAYAQTKNLAYRILTQSTIAKQARYAVQTATAIAKSVTYRVSSSAVVQKTLQYVVYAAGAGTIVKNLTYRIATQAAAITKQVRYAIGSTASVAKNVTYRVGSSAVVQKALRYAIAAAQAGAIVKDLIYRVATQSTIAKQLAYVVQSLEQRVIAKSLTYAVGLEHAITRTMKYAIVGEQQPQPRKVFISRSARLLRGMRRRLYTPRG